MTSQFDFLGSGLEGVVATDKSKEACRARVKPRREALRLRKDTPPDPETKIKFEQT